MIVMLLALLSGCVQNLPFESPKEAPDSKTISEAKPVGSQKHLRVAPFAKGAIAFVNVNVVPMDSERVLRDQTVIVRDGRIASIGPASQAVIPDDATRIDSKGRYLMPGLADMHVHVWDKEELLLYVANGITVVRNMNGRPYHLQWREEIAKGELLGPYFYTSGPTVYNDPEDARQLVISQKEAGYDFIKVYHFMSREPYLEILKTAHEIEMPVVGHKPSKVNIRELFGLSQSSLEHLLGYVFPLESKDSPLREALKRGQYSFRYTYGGVDIDESGIPELAAATREAGLWNCPTLVALDRWIPPDEARAILNQPHMRFVPPRTTRWKLDNSYLKDSSPEIRRQGRRVRRLLVKGLHDAGARFLLGSDAGGEYVAAGFSIHTELKNLVEAGLTPYQAIKTGTFDAAEFLKASDEFGTISTGKRADLILLEANPLENISNVNRRVGVMARGRWLSEKELRGMLEAQAAKYARN